MLAFVDPIAEQLEDIAGPAAKTVATAIVFVGALVVVTFLGRLIVKPITNRLMDKRGLDKHVKKPLQKLVSFLIPFAAIAVAFGAAGLGSFLQAVATIGAAATLAIGFALQDVVKNFAAGIFIFTDKPFRIGDWIEWDGNSGVVEESACASPGSGRSTTSY